VLAEAEDETLNGGEAEREVLVVWRFLLRDVGARKE
jgi:hypothetical protein